MVRPSDLLQGRDGKEKKPEERGRGTAKINSWEWIIVVVGRGYPKKNGE